MIDPSIVPYDPDGVVRLPPEEFKEWCRANSERLDEAQRERMKVWEYYKTDQFRIDVLNEMLPMGIPPWED